MFPVDQLECSSLSFSLPQLKSITQLLPLPPNLRTVQHCTVHTGTVQQLLSLQQWNGCFLTLTSLLRMLRINWSE